MYSMQLNQKSIQSGRFSQAFSNSEAAEGHPKRVSQERAVVLRRPGGAFLLDAHEWIAALVLPALFAPQMLLSPTWPLTQGDEYRVSDEDAFDFAELLEIALDELPETGVAQNLVWAEFRGGGIELLRGLIDFCREGGFSVASADSTGD
jgi:hypothetical protein